MKFLLYLAAILAVLACILFAQTPQPVYIDNEYNPTVYHGNCRCVILRHPLIAGTEHLYRNGIRMSPYVDYQVSGNTITLSGPNVPLPGDRWIVDYRTQ